MILLRYIPNLRYKNMAQIIISLLIFILTGLSGVNTVQAGKYYYFPKNELNAQLQSVRPGGQNIDVAEWLEQQGIDSAEYTKLIDAISRGISEENLKSLLSEMGASEAGIQKILSYLDSLGAATSTPPTTSSEGQKQASTALTIKTKSSPPVKSPEGGVGGSSGNATSGRATEQAAKLWLPSNFRVVELPKIKQQVTELREAQVQALQSLKTAEPEARKAILTELQAKRQALRENIQTSRQEIREQAKTIRAQFREKMEAAKDAHGSAMLDGRVAIAHAYGVRVANRFQVAIARLENILNRLESRKAKLEAQGKDVSEIAPAIEEAKNTLTESKAKLVELEALYEEMLTSDNPSELAREAAAKVKELKNQLSEVMEAAKTAAKDIRRGMVITKPGTIR